ncbi:hypothetical protein Defa_19760 [Desulfovibrio sp. TH_2024_36128]|uniref:Uncharacterized protein n=1 Tax=Desulfovibrio falkowii TaxID=3136602 RepID=A0ABQ0EA05_9BACT
MEGPGGLRVQLLSCTACRKASIDFKGELRLPLLRGNRRRMQGKRLFSVRIGRT